MVVLVPLSGIGSIFLSPLFLKSPAYAVAVTAKFTYEDAQGQTTDTPRLDTAKISMKLTNSDINDHFPDYSKDPTNRYRFDLTTADQGSKDPCVASLSNPNQGQKNEGEVIRSSEDEINATLLTPYGLGPKCQGVGTKKIMFGISAGKGKFEGGQVIYNSLLVVQQVGGGRAEQTPTDPQFGKNDTPQVILNDVKTGNNYVFWWHGEKQPPYGPGFAAIYPSANSNDIVIVSLNKPNEYKEEQTLCMDIFITGKNPGNQFGLDCTRVGLNSKFKFVLTSPTKNLSCKIMPTQPEINKPVSLVIINANPNAQYQSQLIKPGDPNPEIIEPGKQADANGTVILKLGDNLPAGQYTAIGKDSNGEVCTPRPTFTVVSASSLVPAIPTIIFPSGNPTLSPFPPPCKTISNGKCQAVDTALGQINVDPAKFIGRIFGILLGISGGIALILIIYSGYKLMLAQGNPEAIQGARETLTSAIVGLLFIIFSVVILKVIGVDILHIPGFK